MRKNFGNANNSLRQNDYPAEAAPTAVTPSPPEKQTVTPAADPVVGKVSMAAAFQAAAIKVLLLYALQLLVEHNPL